MMQYCLSFVFLILLVKLIGHRSKTQNPKPNLPPGPWKLPIIGHMHYLLSSLPHHALHSLAAAHGPLIHLQLGRIPTVVVSSGDAAREMLKTHDPTFSSRPKTLFARIMLYQSSNISMAPYGDHWRQVRALCAAELLSPRRVRWSQPIREEATASLIRSIAACRHPVNLSEMVSSFTYRLIARVSLGSSGAGGDARWYLTVLRESLVYAFGFHAADLFPSWPWVAAATGLKGKLERYHAEIDGVLQGIIAERRAAAGGGEESSCFLDVLLKLQDEGKIDFSLTDDKIKAIIFDVLSAGSGTSASTVVWTMVELMGNPRAMKIAQDELRRALAGKTDVRESDINNLPYLKLVVKESLRLHPPVPLLLPHESIEDCKVQGFDVPAKTRVVFNVWSMGRDRKRWGDDAAAFRPERFEGSAVDFKGGSYDYMPFGAGRRVCPGIQMGVATVELVLARLLYHFDWRLPDELGPLDKSESAGIGARKRSDLVLRATTVVALPLD